MLKTWLGTHQQTDGDLLLVEERGALDDFVQFVQHALSEAGTNFSSSAM